MGFNRNAVKYHLKRDGSTLLTKKTSPPCFEYAVRNILSLRPIYDVKMIQLLLQRIANQNEYFDGRSAWLDFLKNSRDG